MGSAVFFWRWDEEYIRDVALGSPPMWIGKPPQKIERQRGLGDKATVNQLKEKINKIRVREYLMPLLGVLSTINYFAVVKEDDDLHPVYDGTKSGLNDALWVP